MSRCNEVMCISSRLHVSKWKRTTTCIARYHAGQAMKSPFFECGCSNFSISIVCAQTTCPTNLDLDSTSNHVTSIQHHTRRFLIRIFQVDLRTLNLQGPNPRKAKKELVPGKKKNKTKTPEIQCPQDPNTSSSQEEAAASASPLPNSSPKKDTAAPYSPAQMMP